MATNHQDTEILEQMISCLQTAFEEYFANQTPLNKHDEVVEFVQSHPQLIYPLIDIIIAESHAETIDDTRLQSCFYTLEIALTESRYRLDDGYLKAQEYIAAILEHILMCLPTFPLFLVNELLRIMSDAKLQLPPPFIQALQEHVARTADALESSQPQLAQEPPSLDILTATLRTDDPFELHEFFANQLTLLKPDDIASCIYALATDANPLGCELAVLQLLHSDKTIRHWVMQGLLHLESIQHFPAHTLRRMIVIRNWLLSDERPTLDLIIKRFRRAGVECAPWPKAETKRLMATEFDGAGAQCIMFESKHNNTTFISSLIVKEHFGAHDAWTVAADKHLTFKQASQQLSERACARKVNLDYAKTIINHFIAVGHEHNLVPDIQLLNLVEITGLTDIQPRPIHFEKEAARLMTLNLSKFTDPQFIAQSLERSGLWYRSESFTETWFEGSDEIDERLDEVITTCSSSEEFLTLIFHEVILDVTDHWLERLTLMTLWAQSSAKKNELLWQDMVVLVNALVSTHPAYIDIELEYILFLHALAAKSMQVYFARRHEQQDMLIT